MIDRVSTFANEEMAALLRERFVPVAIDQAYQRRQQDAEGEFYREFAGQGPRKDFEGGMFQFIDGPNMVQPRPCLDEDLLVTYPLGVAFSAPSHPSPLPIQSMGAPKSCAQLQAANMCDRGATPWTH